MTLAPPATKAKSSAPAVGRRRSIRQHRWFVPLVFIIPTLAVQGVFLFLPLVNTFVLAFTDASTVGGGTFTGVDNFATLAADGAFWAAVGRTFLYMAITVPVITVVSLAIAVLVNTSVRGASLVRPILFSPMVMPMAVVALMFQYVLSSDGLANQILQGLRITTSPVPFLNDSDLALFSLMIVTVWKGCALYTLILLAALQNVSRELDEAAQIDGASWPVRTLRVTL
ncbi:carbohydrate ABC transporter permease, partial [Phytoactinopolyspora endophytica]|uniref:carbohydrate ABC transporter permease n=1 Tax=Phytoactinopolyspora endophytica TaxID=1642495 RepID=UPI0013EB4E29